MYEEIKYAVKDGIARITLNRPDRMNAWTDTMEREVREAMESAGADGAVRVIILTGEGRAFCAGADMDNLGALAPDDITATEWTRPFDMNSRPDWQTRYSFYPTIRKPIIAMLNGATAGIGLVHALYCDIRFATDNAAFSTSFARRGLIAEHGLSWMLPRIVGHANAIDLLISARKFRSPEAYQMGLVNKIYAPDELEDATMAYAKDLAENVSPRAMGVIKAQMYEVPFQTLAEATITANKEMALSVVSEDFKEGVAHFVEKRQAMFTGK